MFKQHEDGSYTFIDIDTLNRIQQAMPVLIIGQGFGIDEPDATPDVDVIASSPIDFAIDFGPMMDQWSGGVVVARIEPIDGDTDAYRVTEHHPIPATYRQTGNHSLILYGLNGDWFLTLKTTDDGIDAAVSGDLPDATDPLFAPLWEFLASLDLDETVD